MRSPRWLVWVWSRAPASPAAPGAVQETPKGASPLSGVRPQTRVSTASASASGGAVEKVISVPSDEEEEAGDNEGLTGSATGKEGPTTWASHPSESEADDDDASIHEALSSEEEVLVSAGQQRGTSPFEGAPVGVERSVRESPARGDTPMGLMATSLSVVTGDSATAVLAASVTAPVDGGR
ncbi:ankyrin repeat and SAM domain-containing protein 6-like [Asparagus officinalis]|uniref:ankyrin repeat and SAM domain-containing protein 6-like n=1 Tax=Asparagus officinalis TaxID=4686 RepID=UPI00098E37B5|nr:ankyrin repeat and SAM domain-containing protein 6-like [Asparagus officinalis]